MEKDVVLPNLGEDSGTIMDDPHIIAENLNNVATPDINYVPSANLQEVKSRVRTLTQGTTGRE
ncbi:hypothetical protein GTO89_02855 [Heliobacterium gestii]|uniref:Uncharacterized protein n=1 Tax=Heliomicrobium gestii TaxID=2699 RepID=A0A845LEK8_HELGE|nr:hypothetical protein [Heliomicrobium gestii]MBM7865725.1 hypothetical protein [Heliomicrobium gestii]MZP41973.1 hypothetical protein [Heliomicrobium gestii]